MNNSQLINQTSNETEWYTPWKIILAVKTLMGSIDLDPFSCEAANNRPEGKLAHQYFDIEANGLEKNWFGNVWSNHPFGREHNEACVGKICFEYVRRDRLMKQACCITFASTSEKWFAPLMRYPQFFFTGRVQYLDGLGLKEIKGVPKGSVITFFPPEGMAYGEATALLRRAFDLHGFKGVAK